MRLVVGILPASGDLLAVFLLRFGFLNPCLYDETSKVRSTYRAATPRRQKEIQRREALGLLTAVEISECLRNGTPDAITGIALVNLVSISQEIGREDGIVQQ